MFYYTVNRLIFLFWRLLILNVFCPGLEHEDLEKNYGTLTIEIGPKYEVLEPFGEPDK